MPPRPRNLSFDHKNKVLNSPHVAKQRGPYDGTENSALEGNDRKFSAHHADHYDNKILLNKNFHYYRYS